MQCYEPWVTLRVTVLKLTTILINTAKRIKLEWHFCCYNSLYSRCVIVMRMLWSICYLDCSGCPLWVHVIGIYPYIVHIYHSSALVHILRNDGGKSEFSPIFSSSMNTQTFSVSLSIWISKHSPMPWWGHQMDTFSALLAICAGNSPVPDEFTAQRPVTRSFDFFICTWINGIVNNREAGDLRRHRAHYDVTNTKFAASNYLNNHCFKQ